MAEAKILSGATERFEDMTRETTSLKEALDLLLKLVRRTHPSNPKLVSVLVKDYVALQKGLWLNGALSEGIFKRRRAVARRFARKFGHRELHTISDREVNDFVNIPRRVFAKYAGQDTTALRNFFDTSRDTYGALLSGQTAADRARTIDTNFKPNPPKAEKKIEYTKANEMAAVLLLAWTRCEYRQWIVVLVLRAFAGIHLSEIMCLRWRDITMDGIVDVKESALGNHCPRFIPLCPAGFSWIIQERALAERENRLDSPVFPGMKPDDMPSVAEPRLRRKFEMVYVEICEAAKIPKISNGLRRAFATHAFRWTYNLPWTKRQMGSHKIDLFDFYISLRIELEEAQEYFSIVHPNAKDFGIDLNLPWILQEMFLTKAHALDDYNAAVAAKAAEAAAAAACFKRKD